MSSIVLARLAVAPLQIVLQLSSSLSSSIAETSIDEGQTDVTKRLNAMLGKSSAGVYKGGKGVIVRAQDGLQGKVVPGTLIVNDIITPSTMYLDGNIFCPNKGWSGYNKATSCTDDPFARAAMGSVTGSDMALLFPDFDNIQSDSWNKGVFYGTDANAVDQRCIYEQTNSGYDCPGGWIPWGKSFEPDTSKLGAGNYPAGNPLAGGGGGGAGCHFSIYDHVIDQFDAAGQNLVGNQWCECNYNLNGNWWQDWVKNWKENGHAKQGSEWMAWFGKGKAPSFGADIAMCWVNNPRDMIMLQNAMWWFRDDWNNNLIPESQAFDDNNPPNQRRYWGWNEIPLDNSVISNPRNWDAVVIKLPPAVCGGTGTNDNIDCLTSAAQAHLEGLIDSYVSKGYLTTGVENVAKRPGSYVVFLKEWYNGNRAWERGFFCSSWNSPSGKYAVVYNPISGQDKTGSCYLDHNKGPSPSPPTPPAPPSPPPGPARGGVIRWLPDKQKCMDLSGGDLTNGNKIEIWTCNNHGTNQNWVVDHGSIKNGRDMSKCIDMGDMKAGTQLQIWDCNGLPQQHIDYNYKANAYQTHDASLCWDLSGGNAEDGTKLEVWGCNGKHNQWWTPPSNDDHHVGQISVEV